MGKQTAQKIGWGWRNRWKLHTKRVTQPKFIISLPHWGERQLFSKLITCGSYLNTEPFVRNEIKGWKRTAGKNTHKTANATNLYTRCLNYCLQSTNRMTVLLLITFHSVLTWTCQTKGESFFITWLNRGSNFKWPFICDRKGTSCSRVKVQWCLLLHGYSLAGGNHCYLLFFFFFLQANGLKRRRIYQVLQYNYDFSKLNNDKHSCFQACWQNNNFWKVINHKIYQRQKGSSCWCII